MALRRTSVSLALAAGAALALTLSPAVVQRTAPPSEAAANPAAALVPLSVSVVDTGPLTVPWEVVFAPDGTMVYNQRGGGITARPPGQAQRQLTTSGDFGSLFASGEAGLLGMALDPAFGSRDGLHRKLYTCETTVVGDQVYDQVRRWTIDAAWTRATRDTTILPDAPATRAAFHAGCRLLFDRTGNLLVSVGDAGTGRYPQDPTALAGKVLRIDTEGRAAAGNPDLGGDPRVWTLGHRNPQGLALRPGTNQVWEAEHGPDVDDEVNRLVGGHNYGWDPLGANGGYDQTVPMTFKGATQAKYRTGYPTMALSGATFLNGPQWGSMNGSLVVASLKAQRLLVFGMNGQKLAAPVFPPELVNTYGRLRAVRQGPDGALYVTTSNGGTADKILRVAPAQ